MNRPTLTLTRRREPDPAPAPNAVEPTPEPTPLTWKCRPALAARIRTLGDPPGGFIGGVVVSAVRNRERVAAGEREDLKIVGVPAGACDRLARAAAAAGCESVSEFAERLLARALDECEATEMEGAA